MKIAGDYRFEADRRAVWKALQDPRRLAATLPGVRSLEVVGPDRYAVTADVGVGSVKGLYEGTFALEDKKDFESCTLTGSARGAAGSIEVKASTRLSDAADDGTLLEYEADTQIGGAIAGVGQRMITAASRKMSKEFFSALDRSILGTDQAPPALEPADAPATVGQVFTKPPAPPNNMRTFVVGVVVGFALALIGVAVGRRTARVKPAPFTYHRPSTRSEVDSLMREFGDEAKILAGGQSLIPILNMRLAGPSHLIDINHLEDEVLEPVRENGTVTFGPVVRQMTAEHSALVTAEVPLLARALDYVAHPAIRTRGTITGSIAHADPAAELPAVLTVLGGEVRARSAGGGRAIPGGNFCAGPLENCLGNAEWVERVTFPVKQPGEGFAFVEFARRAGDYALCGVAVAATTNDDLGTIALSYLGMGDIPLRLETPQLDDAGVAGTTLEDVVGSLVEDNLEPAEDIHATATYRMWLARRLGTQAARSAWHESRQGMGG